MWSRRDDVDHHAAVERALSLGICGMGEPTEERARRRLERFTRVPAGAFVWTRDVDGLFHLGCSVRGSDVTTRRRPAQSTWCT